jgi:hypothetical protein
MIVLQRLVLRGVSAVSDVGWLRVPSYGLEGRTRPMVVYPADIASMRGVGRPGSDALPPAANVGAELNSCPRQVVGDRCGYASRRWPVPMTMITSRRRSCVWS